MANDKLQDLIETLKKQGVESGEKAANEIIDSARKKADGMIADANSKANSILTQAQEEADKQIKRLQSSMEIAASQFVNNLKGIIEQNLISIPLKKEITGQLSDPGFLKTLMSRFVETYAKTSPAEEIALLLPKDATDELMQFAIELMARHYGAGKGEDPMVITLDAQDIKFGFQVSKKDGNVRLDFSDGAFLSLFLGFLTAKFRGLFKGIKIGDISKK